MASELSQFIESELRQKGYAYEDDEDNPHANLIGALRVEVWSDKHQQQTEADCTGALGSAGSTTQLSVQCPRSHTGLSTDCRRE
jgi:hypothetical protein